MSLINQNPGDFFNGGSLYAYSAKTFYPHGTIYGSAQELDALSTYTAFAEHVGLQAGKTMHPTDVVLFPSNYLLIEGKKYFDVVIYTPDLVLSPNGNPIHAYVVDPLESEFSVHNPMRPFDYFYKDILKTLNASYQLYMNLQVATKYVEDTINLITPIKGTGLTVYDIQNNIIANNAIIMTKLPKAALNTLDTLTDFFFNTYDELTKRSGVGNVVKEIPANTSSSSFINYCAFKAALNLARGGGIGGFTGIVKSFYYQNPEEAFRKLWYDLYSSITAKVATSLTVLQQFGLTAPTQKTDWITSIEGTGGKYNIYGTNNNWDNPLTLQEMEDGFGQIVLATTTIPERTTTTAKVSVELKNDFSETLHEVGLLYSSVNATPAFTEAEHYAYLSQYTGFTPTANTSRVSQEITETTLGGGKTYQFDLSALSPTTLYNVRPYIIFHVYEGGELVGYRYTLLDVKSFSTDLAIPVEPYVPSGLTAVVSERTQQTAKVSVSVGSTYTGAITERGVLVSSVNEVPVFDNMDANTAGLNNMKFKSDSLSDDYVVLLNSLGWKTKYFVRPYIVNYPTYDSTPLIVYGDAVSFRTLPDADIPFLSVSGKKTTDGENIDLDITCSLAWDAEEDTEVYYYIQNASQAISAVVPTNAIYVGKKDYTVSSSIVNLKKQISIVGLASGIYKIVVYGKNSSGTAYSSLQFAVGIADTDVTQGTLTMGETSYSSPTATLSAVIENNAYVYLSAIITKLGSTFEWAKLQVFSSDRNTSYYTEDLSPSTNITTVATEYSIYKKLSAIPANSNLLAVFTVKTSYEQKEFTQAFTTPATWDLTYLYKPIAPVLTKTVNTNTSDITVKVTVPYNKNIEAGGKMTLCIYKPGATNGQNYSLTNYTEKREIIATKGQKDFLFDLNFTENTTYTFVAFYTDTDTRVYDSSYLDHAVELADVLAFTKYYLFYNLNGAEGTISPTEGNPGSTVFITAEKPIRTGYTFVGWNTQPYGSGTDYMGGNSYVINASITLYAQWISSKLTVTFETLGGNAVSSQVINKGDTCTRPTNPTKTGYVFSHWHESTVDMLVRFDFATPITVNKILYAFWVSETTSNMVSFDSKGGNLVSFQTVLYNQKAVKPANPTRTGYYFLAWYTDEAYQNLYDFNLPVTAGIVLYAKWSQAKFTVTFNSNGGTAVASQEVAAGGLVQRPASPTKTGKYFVDWTTTPDTDYSVNTQLFDFSTPVTGNITLYACYSNLFVQASFFILKYTDNNEKTSQEPYITESMPYGTIDVASQSLIPSPEKPLLDGYTFEGWYFIANEIGFDTAPNTLNWGINMLPFDLSQERITDFTCLFTKWRKGAVSYNVTFSTGNGTAVASQKVIAGGKIVQPVTPTREGYSFGYWYLSNPQVPFDLSSAITSDIVLTAYWIQKISGTTRQVIFNSVGGSEIDAQEVADGGLCIRPANPAKENYQFVNWFTSLDYSQVFAFTTPITSNITLYAKWDIISLEKDVFNPPKDALPGERYYFYDRIWVRDELDNRWRLDLKSMYEAQVNKTTTDKAEIRVLSRSTKDIKTDVESVYEELEKLSESTSVNIQTILNLLKGNQSTMENLSALTDPHIIHIKKGEYLSDVINEINANGDATAEYPYTIYFYNHSRTMDWSKFTGKIHVPEYVNIVLMGDISWWEGPFTLGMTFEDFGAISTKNKLFLGFDFDRTPPVGSYFRTRTGMPVNMQKMYFGGLDSAQISFPDYGYYEDTPLGPLGLIYIEGDRIQDERDERLYKKVGNTLIDVTPVFNWCDLSCNDLTGSYFFASEMKNAYLQSCNLSYTNFRFAWLNLTRFENSVIYNAIFENTKLAQAVFHNALIEFTSFTNADMSNVNLAKAKVFYCFFIQTNLTGADLRGCKLNNSDLTSANLQDILVNTSTDFKGVNLTGCTNLPVTLNTKSLFIAAVGTDNVNAATLWIDGTSILA